MMGLGISIGTATGVSEKLLLCVMLGLIGRRLLRTGRSGKKCEDDFVKAFKEVRPRKINTSYMVHENRCTDHLNSDSSQRPVLLSSVPRKRSTATNGKEVPQKRSTGRDIPMVQGGGMVPQKLCTGKEGSGADQNGPRKQSRSDELLPAVHHRASHSETSSSSSSSSSTSSSS